MRLEGSGSGMGQAHGSMKMEPDTERQMLAPFSLSRAGRREMRSLQIQAECWYYPKSEDLRATSYTWLVGSVLFTSRW